MLLIKNIAKIVGIDDGGRVGDAERIKGRERLQGAEMASLGTIDNAWLLADGERIVDYGSMDALTDGGRIAAYGTASELPADLPEDAAVVDAEGGMLFPSWCDSHTHLVYAGSREGEFVDKINGLTYEEIARRGGGILNSADLLHETSEDELYRQAMERVAEIIKMGTGAVEIKSGYGLTLEDELKMLRVIRRIRQTSPLTVKATFLGAHAVGRAYKGRQGDYVRHIIDEMIPAVAAEGLADYVDVFCDEGFFTLTETAAMLEAAAKYGIRPKIHANELAVSGGVQLGVAHNALSVDHLERMGAEEIAALKGSATMPTLLPGAAFFLGLPLPPAREMLNAGLGVALASDFNPGSSPSGNMAFMVSLACIRLRMTPAEAINAATLNGAYAMGVSDIAGSVTRGKLANFFITRPMPSVEFLPYSYSSPLIRRVFLRGREV
ncbi:MAG: imidazolonepropionase [Alistipes sp.]|jgi:imidazolonepropionase|nr:imidazolonepropionase [Alistipes sp.]